MNWRAFFRGMGSILDLSGQSWSYERRHRHRLSRRPVYQTDAQAFQADADALASDWATVGSDWVAVGDDLRAAGEKLRQRP